jgi:hypothetical protein
MMRRAARGVLWVALLAIFLPGCTAARVAKDEAALNAGLVKIQVGLTWAAGHEPEIVAAIDQAAALDPSNKTLATGAAKAKALVASGDIQAAQTVFAGVVAVTKPVAGVTATTAASQ